MRKGRWRVRDGGQEGKVVRKGSKKVRDGSQDWKVVRKGTDHPTLLCNRCVKA